MGKKFWRWLFSTPSKPRKKYNYYAPQTKKTRPQESHAYFSPPSNTKNPVIKIRPTFSDIDLSNIENKNHYEPKRLITPTEQKYFFAIRKTLSPTKYALYPQINLATIIEKVGDHTYQNELFRNIDFVVFDTNYMPVLLIEINDKTHKTPTRIERDKKIKEICYIARLPIIELWTDWGIDEEHIANEIKKYCP